MRTGDSRPGVSDGGISVHVRHPLQPGCDLADALTQQNAAGYGVAYIVLVPQDIGRDVNARPRPKLRFVRNEPPHRLLVKQGEVDSFICLLDGVSGVVVVEGIDAGGSVIHVGNRRLIGVEHPVCNLLLQSLVPLSAPHLCKPPLFVLLLGDVP